MKPAEKPRRCSGCGEVGHRIDSCPAAKPPSGLRVVKPAKLAAVTVSDLPALKSAVVAIVDALEKVEPQHRPRVLESARLILGDP